MEVKGTGSEFTSFDLTVGEWNAALTHGDRYWLFLVANCCTILGKSSLRSRSLRTVISGGSACQDCGGGHWGQTPCCRWRLPGRTPRVVGWAGLAWEREREEVLLNCTLRKADVELLAYVDQSHGNLSGPATKHILQREYAEYGQAAFKRIAQISVAQIYRFRNSAAYRKRNTSYQPTRNCGICLESGPLRRLGQGLPAARQ